MCEELTSDVVHVRESWQAGHSTCRSVRVTKSKLATLPLMAQQERLLEGSCKTQAAPEREQGYRRSERSTSPLTLGWNTASLYHSVYRFLNHPQDGANPTLMLFTSFLFLPIPVVSVPTPRSALLLPAMIILFLILCTIEGFTLGLHSF